MLAKPNCIKPVFAIERPNTKPFKCRIDGVVRNKYERICTPRWNQGVCLRATPAKNLCLRISNWSVNTKR